MSGRVAALYRHPVKGFTPELLATALLQAGGGFPCDRLFAVENGPSGFDPAAPAFLPKKKFTALASIPALALARTVYDEAAGVLHVEADGCAPIAADLGSDAGRAAFADWLAAFIPAEDQKGPLRVLEGPGGHRFFDDKAGAVSLINLESVRDLARRLGRPVDPLRFRGNVLIEGWRPWSELELEPGAVVRLGEVEARVVKPIVRCAATHVDPVTGRRDMDLVPELFAQYGRMTCGLYLQVAWGGQLSIGDAASVETAIEPIRVPVGDEEQPPAVRQ